ncbi:hypothetical protein B0H10DRAFT_2192565, partial [Mycena sp. CBHHK59/15]
MVGVCKRVFPQVNSQQLRWNTLIPTFRTTLQSWTLGYEESNSLDGSRTQQTPLLLQQNLKSWICPRTLGPNGL